MQVATPKKGYKIAKTSFGKYIEIPEGWSSLTLKEVCKEIASGGTPSRTEEKYFGGDIPWVVVSDIKPIILETSEYLTEEGLKNSSAKLWDKGTVILSTGATIGKVGIAGVELCTKQGVTGLVPKKSLSAYFLAYYLKNITNVLKRGAAGATITEIYKKELEKIFVTIPPLSEQQQIVSILSNIDDAIQKTDQIIEQSQRLKKGMMQKLLTKGIGHTKFKKVKWFFGKEIQIPEAWEMTELEKCVDSDTLITYGIVQAGDNISNGIPYIRTNDMLEDVIPVKKLFHTTPEIHKKYKRTQLKKGDIVCTVRASVGKFHIVPEELENANLSRGVARISPRDNLDNVFLYYSLQSNFVKEQLNTLSKGSTFLEITMFQLRKILTPISTNVSEQQQIASILSNIDTQIQKEKLHKSNLEQLKKGLMQKLLTGQIRVKV